MDQMGKMGPHPGLGYFICAGGITEHKAKPVRTGETKAQSQTRTPTRAGAESLLTAKRKGTV